MRAITKGLEPRSLTEHKTTAHCDYENYQGKHELRQELVHEQRGLCCYCMGRIRPDMNSMKIEHWKSQTRFASEQLNYRNLLGACLGGMGKPNNEEHCDTRKGDRDLRWNPAELEHQIETRVIYLVDGTICANNDDEFDKQLNEVLNLNLRLLKNNRKSLLDGIMEWWKRKKPIPRDQLEREIQKRTEGEGELEPFSPVVVWWLKKKLMNRAR